MGLSIRIDVLKAVYEWLREQGVDATLNITAKTGKYTIGGVPNISIRSCAVRLEVLGSYMVLTQYNTGLCYTKLGRVDMCDPAMCEQILTIIQEAERASFTT